MKSSLNIFTNFHSGFELHIESGAERGRFITLQTRYVKIGRVGGQRKHGWVYIDDQTLSTHHITLLWDSVARTYRLIHESETNPTLVNGRSVKNAVLRVNDVVKMGNVSLRLLALPAGVDPTATPLWAQLRSVLSSRPDGYQVTLFYFNLSSMLTAGIPISRCLDTLKQEMTDPILRILVDEISTDVPRGSSLSHALRVHETYFSPLEVALVRAGETSGQLPLVLQRLAEARQRGDHLRRQVQSALVYPCFVLVAGLVLLTVLSQTIFSTLVPILQAHEARLSQATRLLLWVSQQLRDPLVVGLGVVAVLLLGLVAERVYRSPRVRNRVDDATFAIPVLGKLRMNLAATRFCSNLALLYRAGIPLVEAVRQAGATVGSMAMERQGEAAAGHLVAGETLSEALTGCQIFPSVLISMIEVGEASGKLEEMLLHVERWLSGEAERTLEELVAAIEPLTMVLLGLFVGFIAIAGFAPAYQMVSTLQ